MPGIHVVEVGPAVVVERFRSWSQGEHLREWRALRLLAEHAPGLADPARRLRVLRSEAARQAGRLLALLSGPDMVRAGPAATRDRLSAVSVRTRKDLETVRVASEFAMAAAGTLADNLYYIDRK
jgi:hypothetical protein